MASLVPRFRFSLRTLVLLVLACSLTCGHIGRIRTKYVAQAAALRGLRTDRPNAVRLRTQPAKPQWLRVFIGREDYQTVTYLMIRGHRQNITDVSISDSGQTARTRRFAATGDDLKSVAKLFTLEELVLCGSVFGGDHLELLRPLRHTLKSLIFWSDGSIADGDLRHIAGFHALQVLDLRGADIGDVGLRHLKGLTSLRRLDLSETNVTAHGIACLRHLSQLQHLELQDCAVTDDGMRHIAVLQRLHTLSLNGTAVTDDGLRYLSTLPQLQELSLDDTSVTDNGIELLSRVRTLRYLSVQGTRVTDGSVEDILRHLPELKELVR